ncbi:hypothetical protein L5B97_07280 [Avibacterium sp. 20-15]|uniref:hypothetical protein n=1 Tax=unclassified Avibacterium TaxID=2685287 RepID=UPI002025E137|nr:MULTISPECIES: hypothetical protein [unclassified Avibacterium]MCW9733273.1 hypothetical protein [Avibacterium sp. 20-15]URL05389.1 hypothetical protein L4F93_05970 [Avibacterium sp. 20-132]
MMKKLAALCFSTTLTLGCTAHSASQLLGGDVDEKGCISSAGYRWSELKQQCVQPFDIADLRFTDPEDSTFAIYVILAQDQGKAEVFSAHSTPNLILDAVKGGYAAKDKSLSIIKTTQGWELKKRPTR